MNHFFSLAFLFVLPAFAFEGQDKTQSEIEALVQKLGSKAFREREKSQQELLVLKEESIPHLRKLASQATEPEVKGRLNQIIETLIGNFAKETQKFSVEEKSPIYSIALSPDAKSLFAVYGNKLIRRWDVDKQKSTELKCDFDLSSVRCSPDGKFIAVAGIANSILIYDSAELKKIGEIKCPNAEVFEAVWSPNSKNLVSVGGDKFARLWDLESGKCIKELELARYTSSVCFSPDGKKIAAGSAVGDVSIWDAESGGELLRIQKHPRLVKSMQFSPDGKQLVTACFDGTVRLFDANSGKPIASFESHFGKLFSVRFSPSGDKIACAGSDGSIGLWEIESHKPLHTYTGHKEQVMELRFKPDGKTILSGSFDGTLRFWHVPITSESH
ncbi:WD40 repeat domain-containing protein [Telmatocola sphagniphila]|uniref:WD40 repeat domain-containing protein n=1 Tax=Telmatocola sphagniphila TaxID=1123043 RepID=A0A8E6B7S4_9BACT|nr:WD40 repeat domain-containing protein [Telmatocola sphagniphila]QVL32829.1 WD40 repeat domain-containing protein [Telmatocola sphagniphila]